MPDKESFCLLVDLLGGGNGTWDVDLVGPKDRDGKEQLVHPKKQQIPRYARDDKLRKPETPLRECCQ